MSEGESNMLQIKNNLDGLQDLLEEAKQITKELKEVLDKIDEFQVEVYFNS